MNFFLTLVVLMQVQDTIRPDHSLSSLVSTILANLVVVAGFRVRRRHARSRILAVVEDGQAINAANQKAQ